MAEEEGYVIGYVMFWIKYEYQGHIISIAVDKNYRRMKAGSKLLSKAITILSLLPINTIFLEVREHNTGAVEFYKKFGFKIDRVVPGYYDNDEGAILMYIHLRPH